MKVFFSYALPLISLGRSVLCISFSKEVLFSLALLFFSPGRSHFRVWQSGGSDDGDRKTPQYRWHHRDSAGSGANEIHIQGKVRHRAQGSLDQTQWRSGHSYNTSHTVFHSFASRKQSFLCGSQYLSEKSPFLWRLRYCITGIFYRHLIFAIFALPMKAPK